MVDNRAGKKVVDVKGVWVPPNSVPGAPMYGTTLLSVKVPERNPTPRRTLPATSTLATTRGSAGSPGFDATPSGPL